MQAGENFILESDEEILKINSPKDSVGGPYKVIYKDTESLRYAIVSLQWGGEPSLGMRWFWGNLGFPHSRNHSTWFIVPSQNWKSLLNGLDISKEMKSEVLRFLGIENE